ncbi:winged helix-turn-helix domain-containing protein [Gilvibacter sediminis]|uniref:winged helix-turn-helix domain-containing protein n=1 Tax=Gilvibacter sediminis TaxID=379071 RepID=UPI00235009A6|nr:winged helix-turn-helix domain-containing protein [Gilvibacter sediminis]MDC7996643.1 winged helix-turn-helix domain-containing protein [Gilvibacter sediminis]
MSLEIKSRIWIEKDGQTLLGHGRVQLLAAIEATGSLSAAAKSISLSYKKAWRLLDEMNTTAATPLVVTSVGGKDGGGAQLTEAGTQIVASFNHIRSECDKLLDQLSKQLPPA